MSQCYDSSVEGLVWSVSVTVGEVTAPGMQEAASVSAWGWDWGIESGVDLQVVA